MNKSNLKLIPTEGNSTSCKECYFMDNQVDDCVAPENQYNMCSAKSVTGVHHIWIWIKQEE